MGHLEEVPGKPCSASPPSPLTHMSPYCVLGDRNFARDRSFPPRGNPRIGWYCLCFTCEDSESQKGSVTFPRIQGRMSVVSGCQLMFFLPSFVFEMNDSFLQDFSVSGQAGRQEGQTFLILWRLPVWWRADHSAAEEWEVPMLCGTLPNPTRTLLMSVCHHFSQGSRRIRSNQWFGSEIL